MAQGSLDDMLKKSTIRFPEPLAVNETRKLLGYIAKTLPANINYHTAQHFSIYAENKRVVSEPGTLSVTGTIRSLKESMAFDSFSSVPSDEDIARISSLRFSLIPGYELSEHDAEVVKLWKDVKTLAEAYFRLMHKK